MEHEYQQGGILTDTVLEQILQAACYAIAESIESIGRVQLTVEQVDQIPDAVYEFGVEAGFLLQPNAEPNRVQLGSFTVPREYRDWFIRKIQFPLSQLRELPEGDSTPSSGTPPIEWEHPTPQEIIDDYKAETGLGDGKIAEAAERLVPKQNPNDEDPISWRTIEAAIAGATSGHEGIDFRRAH